MTNGNEATRGSLPDNDPLRHLRQRAAGDSGPGEISPEVLGKLHWLVMRAQNIMAHAWMVRTFVKHSDEVEDYPDLNEMARTIFDTFRALETQVDDPESYFKVLRKKIGKLTSAARQFEKDAWHASTHTNFQQAVISAKFVAEQLADLLAEATLLMPARPAPPTVSRPVSVPPAAASKPTSDGASAEISQGT